MKLHIGEFAKLTGVSMRTLLKREQEPHSERAAAADGEQVSLHRRLRYIAERR